MVKHAGKMAKYVGVVFFVIFNATLILFSSVTSEAQEKTINYNIVCWMDLSGPAAGQVKGIAEGSSVWFGYWNKTEGKTLGVKLNHIIYDSKYNAAIVAGRYPGVVASDRPIVMTYIGGPIAMSLLEKLPTDKIPGIMLTPMHGFMNKPYGWQFSVFSTFAETQASVVSYWFSKWKEKRPMRVAGVSWETPSAEDCLNGVKKYCETTPGIEWTVKEITPQEPISLTTVVRRIIASKTDYVALTQLSAGMASFYKGMKELGVLGKIPIANISFNGLESVKNKLGVEFANGQFEAEPFDMTDLSNQGAKLFLANRDEFAKETSWDANCIQGFISASVVTQAAERAIKKLGAKNLTGQAMYDELNAAKFRGLGVVSDIQFKPENRLASVTHMKVFEMIDGKIVDVSGFIPIPRIPKWY